MPVHVTLLAKDAIDNAESGLEVRVPLVTLGSYDRVVVRNSFEHGVVGFVADALALDGEVEKGLGAKVGFVPELWNNGRISG